MSNTKALGFIMDCWTRNCSIHSTSDLWMMVLHCFLAMGKHEESEVKAMPWTPLLLLDD
jgi:hypothetical protein